MKTEMTKLAEKLVKKVASITADSGSFLYCYQPKEPKSLQEKKRSKK